MKIHRILAFAALLLPSLLTAQVNYYGYFTPSDTIKGDVPFDKVKDKGAFEILSFNLVGQNSTSIGSSTAGAGGAGSNTFERLFMLIETDTTVLAGFVKSMVQGKHYEEFVIEAYRVNSGPGELILRISFLLVVVNTVELEGTQGDRGVFRVELDWGAVKIESFKIDEQTGQTTAAIDAVWSRVNNKYEYSVDAD